MRVATFVHVSDLHFGDIDPNTHEPIYDAKAPRIWALSECFDGLLGHTYIAIRQLAKFFREIAKSEEAKLIVTGDITAFGKRQQFEMASQYFERTLSFPGRPAFGLSTPDWRNRAVPGNHDHWPGVPCVIGPPTAALSENFPLPLIEPPLRLQTEHQIRFIRINTDADVRAIGRDRILARGSFTSQLRTASGLLDAPEPNEIRVLLLHHSRLHQGHTLRITDASREALDAFLVDHDIPVIISGHTHAPHVQTFSATSTDRTIPVLEARCGTTTQRDDIPYDWKTLRGRRPARVLERNTLLVHRLLQVGDEMIWYAETYKRTPRGFMPWRGGPECGLRVWPRS